MKSSSNEISVDKVGQMYTTQGDEFEITPAGILLLAGDTAHGDRTQATAIGRINATNFVKKILSAADLAGYKEGHILLTLLQWNIRSKHVEAMAEKACDIASDEIKSYFSLYRDGITMQTVSMLFGRPLTSVYPSTIAERKSST